MTSFFTRWEDVPIVILKIINQDYKLYHGHFKVLESIENLTIKRSLQYIFDIHTISINYENRQMLFQIHLCGGIISLSKRRLDDICFCSNHVSRNPWTLELASNEQLFTNSLCTSDILFDLELLYLMISIHEFQVDYHTRYLVFMNNIYHFWRNIRYFYRSYRRQLRNTGRAMRRTQWLSFIRYS